MGGHAFTANDPSGLSTPRMPPNIYFMLKDHYLQLLSSVYTQIATPIEAPKKLSYGDIDILVSQPKSPPISAEFLAELLAAERVFKVSGSAVTSFALPYPNLPKTYVQLDLHLSPPKIFHWQLFHQSHGDLWNLLGTSIRPFGLTANAEGLHVRIGEIEDLNRKRALLFLTYDPEAVLAFLGLDIDACKRPFESVESLYRYVCGCRFFSDARYVRGELKANDRKRLTQRELYRGFIEDWLPENAHSVGRQKEKNALFSRDGILDESLDRFGKREEYEKRLQEWRNEREKLLAKQQGRQKRKEDAAELEEYAYAWMRWLECNA